MSRSATITISNLSSGPVTTKVVRDCRVRENGDAINNKTIAPGDDGVFHLVAKEDHHGEIEIELVENSLPRKVLGRLSIRSIAEPDGEIEGTPTTHAYAEADGYFISAMGSSAGTRRRVNVLLVQNQETALQKARVR